MDTKKIHSFHSQKLIPKNSQFFRNFFACKSSSLKYTFISLQNILYFRFWDRNWAHTLRNGMVASALVRTSDAGLSSLITVQWELRKLPWVKINISNLFEYLTCGSRTNITNRSLIFKTFVFTRIVLVIPINEEASTHNNRKLLLCVFKNIFSVVTE